MAYQVLARKWRPRNFDAMVGQEHVLRALVNALDNERLHHAYLFTGTRGVGKTTVARVFAKCLNCETGITSQPCGECSACREIDAGRFVDLIEVDAASRTGVDDTRELLENVQYTPTQGRFKVYLIDEVHMFSTHSFNALLKTLEEPPPHVKFLLATTDPQKLPVTILSRCLQFNLKRLSGEAIRDYLARVLEQEGTEYDLPALTLIARGADGSMRDGLSLLDQAIAFGGGRVVEAEVQTMLGTIARDHVFGLIEELADGDGAALMARVAGQAEMGADYAAWLADLLTALQRIALVQQVPEAVDDSLAEPERIRDLAQRISPEDAQLFYQIGLIGRRDLHLSPEPRGGFEMVLLRMLAFRPASAAGGAAASGKPKAMPAAAPGGPPAQASAVDTSHDASPVASPTIASRTVASEAGQGSRQSPLDIARAMLGQQPTAKRQTRPAESASPVAVTSARPRPTPTVEEAPPEVPEMPPEPPPMVESGLSEDWHSGEHAEPEMPPQSPMEAAGESPQSIRSEPHARIPQQATDEARPASPAASAQTIDWLTLMPRLELDGVVQELAAHCVQRPGDSSEPSSEQVLTLAVDPSKSGLLNDDRVKRIRQAVQRALSSTIRVEVAVAQSSDISPAMVKQQARAEKLRQAERSIAEDALVKAMQERMGASVLVDSVRPLN